MGIHLNLAVILHEAAGRHGLGGRVCTMGEQNVAFGLDELARVLDPVPAPLSNRSAPPPSRFAASEFFACLGFLAAESIDVSAREGATHIFDLNSDELAAPLRDRYDLVLNGGTLEHVFHVPNALTNMTRMLRPRGAIVHVLPCHNWVDHGFYQFSPTLMFDYYGAAGFEVLESILVSYSRHADGEWLIDPAPAGSLGSGLAGSLDDRTYLHIFMARRSDAVEERPRPTQSLYSGSTSSAPSRWFEPYLLSNGCRRELQPSARIALTSGFTAHSGHCWSAPMATFTSVADDVEHPTRSRLVLLEDGQPLGPPHSLHQTIREIGGGRYSHWCDTLFFSTSDNSPPSTNGRSYVAVLRSSPSREAGARARAPGDDQ
jgi:hypothetical protein